MQPVAMEPRITPGGQPFYAKLRAEADAALIADGKGKLYLGFHLDPFHHAHWNNLTAPLRFRLEIPDGVKIAKREHEAARGKAASDADPREFLLDVQTWPQGKPIQLTVTYYACVGEKACHTVQQSYVLHRRRDRDGGGARGDGAGYWKEEEFARQMLSRSKRKDRATESELIGLIRPHFRHFDTNRDGYLDFEELKEVARWLNRHHQPGPMPTLPARPPGN
jgi:hypothetical protein